MTDPCIYGCERQIDADKSLGLVFDGGGHADPSFGEVRRLFSWTSASDEGMDHGWVSMAMGVPEKR